MKLKNKVALVTGATSGIGQATAVLFAREGARLILVGRTGEAGDQAASQVKEAGSEVHFIKADVAEPSEVQSMSREALERWGYVDVLVNNAGGGREGPGSVTEVSESDWNKPIQPNLYGVYLVSKAILPSMVNNGGGVIVNNASSYGMVGAPTTAAYSAAKGGVIALTRQMAVDYASCNIRVNCVCPGAIMTPLLEDFILSTEDPEQTRRYLAERCPQERIGRPEEVAQAILFLASDVASYITGVALPVDGGYTAW